MHALPTFTDIANAAKALEGVIVQTPVLYSTTLSRSLGACVYLKLENLQRTSSFKVRGAGIKIRSLSEDERRRGVVASSAGNHAQGVAYHAELLKIPATIVMPETTPFVKIRATRQYGATIVLHGQDYSAAQAHALELAAAHNWTFITPYDDPHVIAGQGTLGLEIMDQIKDLDTLVVPIGGGGLLAGVAIAAKTLNPNIELIGVQTESAAAMYNLFHGKEPTPLKSSIAEGIAVKEPGLLTRHLIREFVDDVVLVSEETIELAINLGVSNQRVVMEGAGAAAVAALLENKGRFQGKRVCAVVSGGNIDPRALTTILMRGLIRQGQIAKILIEAPDQPGILEKIAKIIGDRGINILDVYHQRLFYLGPLKSTSISLSIEVEGPDHTAALLQDLSDHGFKATQECVLTPP